MAAARPDLKNYVGRQLTVIAWLWARTVKSPNPAFAAVDVPLASTFMLSTKAGKEAYVEPVIEGGSYRFTVKVGKPTDAEGAKSGTKLARGANFKCLMSDAPMAGDYIKAEGKAGRLGARLMAIVAEGDRGRVYLAPTPEMEAIALTAQPEWKPETPLPDDPRNFWTVQLRPDDLWRPLHPPPTRRADDLLRSGPGSARAGEGGRHRRRPARRRTSSSQKPAPARRRMPMRWQCIWRLRWTSAATTGLQFVLGIAQARRLRNTFGRQAIPMTWDFAEANPILRFWRVIWMAMVDWTLEGASNNCLRVQAELQLKLTRSIRSVSLGKVVSTDPPYYDNIGYADLSDFFYVWLRRSLKPVFPDLFATLAVPKAEELVATPYRHGSKEKAETFFLDGMTQAMHRLAEQAHPAFPVTIYYAFKQAESDGGDGTTNTGWDTFLAAVIEAGFAISGTWPMRTELSNRMIGSGTNALASSIVLVCRQRVTNAPTATRREFVAALKAELPQALAHLQAGNIAPVDLAQAAIGPGMAVYTRYARVLDAEGQPIPVRAALALINQTLDEALAEQEGDFDADTRWALTWFEQVWFCRRRLRRRRAAFQVQEHGGRWPGRGRHHRLQGRQGALAQTCRTPRRLGPDHRQPPDRLGNGAPTYPGARSRRRRRGGHAGRQAWQPGRNRPRTLLPPVHPVRAQETRRRRAGLQRLVQSWPEITRLARETPRPVQPGTDDLFDQE